MASFCQNCGTPLNEGTKFCPSCGAAQNAAPAPAEQNATQYAEPACDGNGAVRQGFSGRVNHPEIIAAVKKNRKAAGIFAFFLVTLPVIGAVIYALVSEKTDIGQAAMIGGIKSAAFLVFALCSFIKLESADIIGAALSS